MSGTIISSANNINRTKTHYQRNHKTVSEEIALSYLRAMTKGTEKEKAQAKLHRKKFRHWLVRVVQAEVKSLPFIESGAAGSFLWLLSFAEKESD